MNVHKSKQETVCEEQVQIPTAHAEESKGKNIKGKKSFAEKKRISKFGYIGGMAA